MKTPNTTSIPRDASSSAARWATPASPAARSSSTPTAAWDVTAAALSAARVRRRGVAPPLGRHGAGASSGKDPTKVDRSAAYMARHIAKNIVAAKLADRCEVQLAYAIGVAEPVSVRVDTCGTEKVNPEVLPDLIRANFKLTPRGIIESLDLRRPIYKKTAAYGHFGRNDPDFTWEATDKAAKLASDAGVRETAGARK